MADFAPLPFVPVQTHNAAAIAAGASSAKTVILRRGATAISLFWKVTGTGTPRVRLYARDRAGNDYQLGADQTATSGRLDMPAGVAVRELKVEVAETGALQGITATAELFHVAAV